MVVQKQQSVSLRQRQRANAGRVAALLIVSCAAGCASKPTTEVRYTVEGWSAEGLSGRRIYTDHFEIVSTLRDKEFELALPKFVEDAYVQFTQTLPPKSTDPRRLKTYVFVDRTEWLHFTQRRYPDRFPIYARIRYGGYSDGDTAVTYYGDRSPTLATIAHEAWHQYVFANVGPQMPPWLNEGFSCYHEAFEWGGPDPKFTPEHNTLRIGALREAVKRDTVLSLRELINTDAGRILEECDDNVTQAYYAEAWALITFLRGEKPTAYSDALQRMLNDIAAGSYPAQVTAARLIQVSDRPMTDAEAGFVAYFGKRPEELQNAYYDHLVKVAGF